MSAWSNEKPTEPGLYWWRGQIAQAHSLCRIVRGVNENSRLLFVKIEGMQEWTCLDVKVMNDVQWQAVKPPEP